MKIVKRKIKDLIRAEYNPRKITKVQFQDLKDGIIEFGLVQPLVVNEKKERKNVIVGGHQRLKIWEDLGHTEVDCSIVNLPLDKEKKLNIKLNKNGGSFDDDLLQEFFEYEELIEWGFTPDELFDQEEKTDGLIEDDEIPEVKESKVKRGDIWQLGEHRVMCGDSTSSDDVEKLMNGEKADMGFCDPPYNLGYEYNSYNDNKTSEEYSLFSKQWFNNLKTITTKQIITLGTKNINVMVGLGEYAGVGCWVKKNWITSCKIANLQQWEPIFFYGDFSKKKRHSDLFEINRKIQKDVGNNHTCPKQMDLMIDLLDSYAGKSVADLFLGSGTTLIAAEKLKRKCYGMELDEKYCDVIINRWGQFTGQKANKING